jgi:tetratricopeptide (TPR) repeat protein/transcriptional regulator with XRE-family HTH domain
MKAKPPGLPNDYLRHARQQRGWSQGYLADRVGTNAYTVSRWERGVAFPSPFFVQRLMTVFGQDAEALGLLAALPQQTVKPQRREDQGRLNANARTAPAAGHEAVWALPARSVLARSLVGREGMHLELKHHLLAAEGPRSWAVTGLPGVGKTALALELAHDPAIRGQFVDGVLWAGLGKTPRLFDLFARWGRLLGLPDKAVANCSTLEEWIQTLQEAIATRSVLIVLDDAWRIEEALACQIGGPASRYLLTTRFPALAVQFAAPALISLEELGPAEGLELLRWFAPQVLDVEPEEAQRLVHAVGGLPLALTLLGAYLRQQAYTGQPRRIQHALERLHGRAERLHVSQPQAPLETHPSLPAEIPLSLVASIGLSVTALPRSAQEMLAALAFLPPKPASFSEEVALGVSAGTPDTLDSLVDWGLVESVGSGRYRLHQTIIDYMQAHVDAPEAPLRMITWAVPWIETHQDESSLEPELPVLLEALRQAAHAQRWSPFIQGSTHLAPFLLALGSYATLEDLLQQAQTAARAQGDREGLLTSLYYLSAVAEKRGNYAQAEALLQDGVHLARRYEEINHLSEFLMELGVIRSLHGDLTQAQRFLEEGLLFARQSGSAVTQARLLVNLAALLADHGQLEVAEQRYQEALRLSTSAHQPRVTCAALEGLSNVAVRQGDYGQGAAYAQTALTLARQHRFRERLCGILTNLGVLALDQGQWTEAEAAFGESLQWARELNHPEAICRSLVNLSEVQARLRRVAEAEMMLEQGFALARQLDHHHYLCHCFRLLGEIKVQQSQLGQAEMAFAEGIALARRGAYPWVLSALLCGRGETQLAERQEGSAEQSFVEAQEVARTVQSQELEAVAGYGLARLAAQRGAYDVAQRHGQESLQRFAALGAYQTADVRRWLATLPAQSTTTKSHGL